MLGAGTASDAEALSEYRERPDDGAAAFSAGFSKTYQGIDYVAKVIHDALLQQYRLVETMALEGGVFIDNYYLVPTPEARAIAHDEAARVRSALARLSSRDREAILLVAVGGVSMADAAAALGLSVSAVKMRLSRARGRLAAELEARHG